MGDSLPETTGRLRASWTGNLRAGVFRGVIKEQGTDRWVWECQHEHPRRLSALDCATGHLLRLRRKDADLIDPRRDRLWAVGVRLTYMSYVVAETAEKAAEIAADASQEERRWGTDEEYRPRPLTEPLADEGGMVAWGRSLWDGHQLTVNEVVELLERHRPVHDTRTLLMPFVDAPPPMPAESPEAARPDRCTS